MLLHCKIILVSKRVRNLQKSECSLYICNITNLLFGVASVWPIDRHVYLTISHVNWSYKLRYLSFHHIVSIICSRVGYVIDDDKTVWLHISLVMLNVLRLWFLHRMFWLTYIKALLKYMKELNAEYRVL